MIHGKQSRPEVNEMQRYPTLSLTFALLIVGALLFDGDPVSAVAVDEGIVYRDTKEQPPVVFSHEAHKQAGVDCRSCHPRPFKTRRGIADRGNAMTMLSLLQGKYCGACHNGKQAFRAGDKGTCGKCHVRGR